MQTGENPREAQVATAPSQILSALWSVSLAAIWFLWCGCLGLDSDDLEAGLDTIA
jgi:hypothetical protein